MANFQQEGLTPPCALRLTFTSMKVLPQNHPLTSPGSSKMQAAQQDRTDNPIR